MDDTNKARQQTWLDLGDAAAYMGVHFTTLRRWADAGQVPCIRTPGGRRRFSLEDLRGSLARMRQVSEPSTPALSESRALTLTRKHIHGHLLHRQGWLSSLGNHHRLTFRQQGRKLLGLLLQYCSRSDPGEAFLEEGMRLAAEYGATCRETGLSVAEVVETFLVFRRSVVDGVQETCALNGPSDADGLRLYHRMNDFLDSLLLATIESYSTVQVDANGEAPSP